MIGGDYIIMKKNWTAKNIFQFKTRLYLPELTGLKAKNIKELLDCMKIVDEGAIFNHIHNFTIYEQYMALELTSDFAYWLKEILFEPELAEKLSAVDPFEHKSIEDIRISLIDTIEKYLKQSDCPRVAPPGTEFYFIKSNSFVFPLPYKTNNLCEFSEILKKISLSSVFFHVFESHLRLKRPASDFIEWIQTSLEDAELTEELKKINPYSYRLAKLRDKIASVIENHIYLCSI